MRFPEIREITAKLLKSIFQALHFVVEKRLLIYQCPVRFMASPTEALATTHVAIVGKSVNIPIWALLNLAANA